jgi:hypothetical protein
MQCNSFYLTITSPTDANGEAIEGASKEFCAKLTEEIVLPPDERWYVSLCNFTKQVPKGIKEEQQYDIWIREQPLMVDDDASFVLTAKDTATTEYTVKLQVDGKDMPVAMLPNANYTWQQFKETFNNMVKQTSTGRAAVEFKTEGDRENRIAFTKISAGSTRQLFRFAMSKTLANLLKLGENDVILEQGVVSAICNYTIPIAMQVETPLSFSKSTPIAKGVQLAVP